jgi:Ca-activated chloride channel family protein
MTFLWPSMFWFLLVVPLLVVGYVQLVKRRAREQSAVGMMGGLQTRTGKPLGARRHVPVAVFLVGVTILIVGLARPEMTLDLPRREGTVILAFDTSNSMKADDLRPTRLNAAKRAARAFVDSQPSSIEVGVVAFSSVAFLVQPPTDVKDDVRAAIRRLRPEGATSIGHAILTSLNAINGEPLGIDPEAPGGGTSTGRVEFLGSSAIVLLTDGENTSPLDPLEMTSVASEAGVRIFPIGVGSEEGAVVQVDGFNIATALDEPLLREIADLSNGAYFRATDSTNLEEIYSTIDLKLEVEGEKTEVTALFAAAALFFFLIAGALSMVWFGRAP